MNIFNLFSLVSFLNGIRPKPPKMPSRLGMEINELSDELDYFLDRISNFRNGIR